MTRSHPRRRELAAVLTLAVAGAGCASTLRYTPERQPAGITIAADYAVTRDRLRVEIDTGGYRVEEAVIVTADGTPVRPESLEQPDGRDGGGFAFGIGVGSAGRVGSAGLGTGVGVGTTLGEGRGRRIDSHAVAVFPLAAVGPAPWRLRVKPVGIEPVLILLDPARRG